jgi:phosphatidyl-myo-inositol dimannoside synthase
MTGSVRVLLVLTEFPPKLGGMQSHALHLTRYLAARGYEVDVFTYRTVDRRERDRAAAFDALQPFPVRRVLSRVGHWRNIDLLAAHGRRSRPDLVYASTVFYGALAPALGLPAVCRSAGNDVLRPWIAYPFRRGSRLLSAEVVERLLYGAFRKLRRPAFVDRLFQERRHRLMAESLRSMDRVFANSEFTADLLTAAGASAGRVRVVVGGVDVERFARPELDVSALRLELGLPRDRFLLATICRLQPKKGIDVLLAALAELRRTRPEAHLVVVGDGPMAGACRLLAARLGLQEHVSFVGAIPHDRVHPYFWAADAFVLASRESVHGRGRVRDVETMGRVLCEANAAGVPVVAARTGGVPSVIEDGRNGLLFEPDDVAGLVAQVRRLRSEPGLAARLAARGLQVARERFDWRVVVDAHEKAFAQVLASAAAARRSGQKSAPITLGAPPRPIAIDLADQPGVPGR